MAPQNSHTKYSSLGMEWAQIDGQREALFAFVMELEPNKEPNIKTVALTIPNVSGQGDPGQPIYATRPTTTNSGAMPALKPAGPQMPDFQREPGLTVVKPADVVNEDMKDTLEQIPTRRDRAPEQPE